MKTKGWKQNTLGSHAILGGISDEIFTNEDEQELHAEVKPSNANISEVWKGVGQTLRILGNPNLRTILVCSEIYSVEIEKLFRLINTDRVGLLVYDSNGIFVPILDIWKTMDAKWLINTEDEEKIKRLEVHKLNRIHRTNEESSAILGELLKLVEEKETTSFRPEEMLQYLHRFPFNSKRDLAISMKRIGLQTRVLFMNGRHDRYYIITRSELEFLIRTLEHRNLVASGVRND